MNNTRSHAETEMDILLKTTPDAVIRDFVPELLALVEKFGDSGQSGGSAPYVAGALSEAVKHLCLQQPICPVTGIDDEWFAHDEEMSQNKRCSALFKNSDGRAYYLDALIWKTPNGVTYCGSASAIIGEAQERISSRQYVKFPFTPISFYIDVDEHETAPDDWEFTVKDPAQLAEAFAYYDKREVVADAGTEPANQAKKA